MCIRDRYWIQEKNAQEGYMQDCIVRYMIREQHANNADICGSFDIDPGGGEDPTVDRLVMFNIDPGGGYNLKIIEEVSFQKVMSIKMICMLKYMIWLIQLSRQTILLTNVDLWFSLVDFVN